MSMTHQLTLAERFEGYRDHDVHRASSLFPVLVGRNSDTLIVFLDYWRIKNAIDGVTCRIRVYHSEGWLAKQHSFVVNRNHNEISLAAFLDCAQFEGLAEIEFFSDRNLVFSFPAIVAFYRSGGCHSVVHSPGRVKNLDERHGPARSTETNWTCKFGRGVTPFFGLFNGPRFGSLGDTEVNVHDRTGRSVARHSEDFGLSAPFASKVVKIDELFDISTFDGDHFISVNMPDDDCFPRLVVGNFHRQNEFLEATHSFYWITVDDDILQPLDADLLSFIPALNVPELNLEMAFFPTNIPAEVTATLRASSAGQKLRETGQAMTWTTGGAGAELWRYQVEPGISLLSFDFRNQRLPARLNASYRYSVRGANAAFCTDIATGAHAHVYPPKHSHWGHGLISDNYETVVMMRNIAHHDREAGPARATLSVYDSKGNETKRTITVGSESAEAIYLRDLVGGGDRPQTVSWFLRADKPDIEAYWVSFSPDGSICGEHAF